MKNQSITLFLIAFWLFIASCEDDNSNGNLLVKLKNQGRTISQSTIYLKSGLLTNPNIPVAQYEFVQRADGTGDAYFKDLPPNQYFIYATGYDQELKKQVFGESSITIIPRSRQNKYDVTVSVIP